MWSLPEAWLPVSGYEGAYEVSTLGRVRSLSRTVPAGTYGTRMIEGQILKPDPSSTTGYLRAVLSKRSKYRRLLISRLVLSAFRRPPAEGQQADHISGDFLDNRLCNLQWLSPEANRARSQCPDMPVEVVHIHTGVGYWGPSQTRLAKRLGMGQGSLSSLMSGKTKRAHFYTLTSEVYNG